MAQLTIKINGYAYTVGCDDGQEQHLQQMAAEVEQRIDSIKALGGQSGESRLLVLASLLMADELHDTRTTLANLQSELSRLPQAEAEAGQAGRPRRGDCAGAREHLASGGGAAGCVRQFIPGADKQPLGGWRCRGPGHGNWFPPAQAGSGG